MAVQLSNRLNPLATSSIGWIVDETPSVWGSHQHGLEYHLAPSRESLASETGRNIAVRGSSLPSAIQGIGFSKAATMFSGGFYHVALDQIATAWFGQGAGNGVSLDAPMIVQIRVQGIKITNMLGSLGYWT